MPIIDLNQLPAPDVVEELDFETILAERKATLISLYPEDQQEAVARTLTLESEPLVKLLEENAYRELIWRQRVNEAARAVMLACAAGNDLDVIGANYNTKRLIITPADDSTIPPTPAVMESDTDYRLRIQQAFEGLSVAGSVGAYQYHGRSADGRVADISVTSPSPACVTISVLSRENNGVASEDLLAVVRNALNGEDVRPVADRVTVQSAAIVEYQINATLYLYPGPESEPIRAAAVKKLEAYITAQHRLGRDIRLSAIYAALHVEGVQRVELAAPLADIVLNSTQASFCIRDAYFIHCHKGTVGAIRRVVEPLGYLIEVREWWQLNEEPGTFRIVVGVLEQGITEEMYLELERLVADAKPASRHLTGLAISLSTTGNIFAGTGCYHGDALTVYPYTPEAIIVGGDYFPASVIHLIDNLRVNA
ncbi:phage tail protein I [Escherichia coli]|nr:phage tail protein I [Escherichia coli]